MNKYLSMVKEVRFSTKPDVNGNVYELAYDCENKRFAVGYYLFTATKDDIRLSKKEINKLAQTFRWFGYQEIK